MEVGYWVGGASIPGEEEERLTEKERNGVTERRRRGLEKEEIGISMRKRETGRVGGWRGGRTALNN